VQVKLSKEEVDEMVALADLDGDRQLDFQEFCKIANTPPPENFADLRQAWTVFDINKDGFVDASELLEVMQKMPGAEKITKEEVCIVHGVWCV
jgi:Ca2+-binding EF-hand superfamily protein